MLAALGACADPAPVLPPEVMAALPAGHDPRNVARDGAGCWVLIYPDELSGNMTPLTDSAGERICET